MILEICISLEGFENLKIRSNEHKFLKDCAKEIIKELSPIKSIEIIDFIQNYLIPLIYDKKVDSNSFQKLAIKRKYNIIKGIEIIDLFGG